MLQGFVLGFFACIAVWLLLVLARALRRRYRGRVAVADREAVDEDRGSELRYPAVSIRTFRQGCPAAESLKGQRFLPEEAPRLPLPNCTWASCNCVYAHHTDRRTGNIDRRKMIGEEREYPLSMGRDDPRGGRGRRTRDVTAGGNILTPGK
jgi:hypothetical protein